MQNYWLMHIYIYDVKYPWTIVFISNYFFYQIEGKNGLQTNWISAVNNCTNWKTTLQNAARNSSADLWLRYQILNTTTSKHFKTIIKSL